MKKITSNYRNGLSIWRRFKMIFIESLFSQTIEDLKKETIEITLQVWENYEHK